MSYQLIGDVYFTQKSAELMGAGYAILEWFADPMPFSKKMFPKSGLPENYVRMSLHAFMA